MKFETYITNNVSANGSTRSDIPEDVLGGLYAAVNKMNWRNPTRNIIHICDYPPHGCRFTNLRDNYPD
ncbi:10181_t:CDS:2, partial [Scutellospora calospora]